ncbi:FmdB family zinc ribbon protein [Prescottella agglutinans]|uniref:FmdB family regulatory protein n=1 Tax=Prescottella agglutinans TaxID=1644129 RepID=A0ABT6MB45_9NOCA|nr:FmdB family zinc ribbon protein [Prescottella agglutinans]MDH6281531.1 putative FmdB family regulatory protein [Prescottella agglutinans]
MPRRKDAVIPLYQFRCDHCGPFDRTFTMATVPDTSACPDCASDARRQVTAPRLGHGASTQMRLLDATARSASEPAVVQGPRPGGGRTAQKVTTNPLHRKLPRP